MFFGCLPCCGGDCRCSAGSCLEFTDIVGVQTSVDVNPLNAITNPPPLGQNPIEFQSISTSLDQCFGYSDGCAFIRNVVAFDFGRGIQYGIWRWLLRYYPDGTQSFRPGLPNRTGWVSTIFDNRFPAHPDGPFQEDFLEATFDFPLCNMPGSAGALSVTPTSPANRYSTTARIYIDSPLP